MKVSVIIPVYRHPELLHRAIRSVKQQSYTNNEVILVDSSDIETPPTVDKHIHQQPEGPAKARNAGLDSAEGDLIAFLDADDYWHRNKLKTHVQWTKNGHDFVYSQAVITDGNDRFLDDPMSLPPNDPHIKYFRTYGKNMTPSATTVTKELVGDKRFNPELTVGEDQHFFTTILPTSSPYKIEKPLVTKYSHKRSASGGNPKERWVNAQKRINSLTNMMPELKEYEDEVVQKERYIYAKNSLMNGDICRSRTQFRKLILSPHTSYKYYILAVLAHLPFIHKSAALFLETCYNAFEQ